MVNHLIATQSRVLSTLPRNQHRIRLDVLNSELHDERSITKVLRFHFQEVFASQWIGLVAVQLTFSGYAIEEIPFEMVMQPFP